VSLPSRSAGLGALAYSRRRVSVLIVSFRTSAFVYTDTYEEIVVAGFGSQLLGLLDGSLEFGAECDGHLRGVV
jgi:hypothetical protein